MAGTGGDMTYVDAHNAVVQKMQDAFSKTNADITVAACAGPLTEIEIKGLLGRMPAIFTSILKVSTEDTTDNSVCEFMTWILCRKNTLNIVADRSLHLATALVAFLRKLDMPFLYDIGSIVAENVYLNNVAASVWVVSWKGHMPGLSSIYDAKGLSAVFTNTNELVDFEGDYSASISNNQADLVI